MDTEARIGGATRGGGKIEVSVYCQGLPLSSRSLTAGDAPVTRRRA